MPDGLPTTGKLFILRPPTVAAVGGFFLSTPPVRGATCLDLIRAIERIISTHAPVRGATDYLIAQEFPQSWQRHTFSFLNFVFSVPFDFFQTRLDIPKVLMAVIARAVLFSFPPKPVPCLAVLPPV